MYNIRNTEGSDEESQESADEEETDQTKTKNLPEVSESHLNL